MSALQALLAQVAEVYATVVKARAGFVSTARLTTKGAARLTDFAVGPDHDF
jgi:hypothetical protein